MKIEDVVIPGAHPQLLTHIEQVIDLLNNGRYQCRVVSEVPAWTGSEGDFVVYSSGTERALYIYINSAWVKIAWTGTAIITIIENRTDDPSAPETGRVWFRTDL